MQTRNIPSRPAGSVLAALGFRPLLMLLLWTLPGVVQAQFSYDFNFDGGITITGYFGPGGPVAVPVTINGFQVTSIGDYVFYGNTSLTSATIPYSVSSIGDRAFSFCTSLSAITVDALNAVYISVDGVLFDKSRTLLIQCPGGKTGSYTIPNRVASIGNYAFSGCTSLTSVTIPNSVYRIGNDAFSVCTSLTSVTIPYSVYSIGDRAFSSCTSLTDLTILSSIIADEMFSDCTSLTSVTIPNSVTSIGGAAFLGCTSLTNVTIGNSVTNIGNSAFHSCASLTSVTIPNSVTSIGSGAFFSCASLTSVTIPSSVTSIGDSPFGSCAILNTITVDTLNSFYASVDGVLFNKSRTLLIQFPGGKAGSYTIPDSVTSIGSAAFSGCTSLTGVTIPNSVTSIGHSAFSSCTGMSSVTIGNSVTNIGYSAFNSCTNLTGVFFEGNPPSTFGSPVFDGANNVIVYYLPGTSGWGTTFSFRPAVLWNPLAQTGDASFGVRTNRFGFTITGTADIPIVVEAATNLANPAWIPVSTNTLIGGSFYFSDPQWTNHPVRFYRLRSP